MVFRVQDINSQGDGVIFVDGAERCIPGALPGDEVEVAADSKPRIAAAAARVRQLACPHRGCSGCPLLTVPYLDQLEAKRRLVERVLSQHINPGELPPTSPTLASPKLEGYRASAKLSISRGPRWPRIGLYRRGSHEVVDLPKCAAHERLVNSGIRALRNLLARAPALTARGPGSGGWIRYVALQASVLEQKLLVTLVTRDHSCGELLPALAARLREFVPQVSGVLWNLNPSPGNEIFGDDWRSIWGEGHIRERMGEVVVRASAGSFLQINREQAARAYRETIEALAPRPFERALDLYCGVGAMALHLAGKLKTVVAIDVSSRAVSDAEATAREMGLENVSFRSGRVEEELPEALREGLRPDIVTLNPARKGIEPPVVEALRRAAPRAIAYVSCNPESLARDVTSLCAGRLFRMERIQPIDFFPHTGHVETVVLLHHSKPNDSP